MKGRSHTVEKRKASHPQKHPNTQQELLLAVGMCAVSSFQALPGLSCFLRVTQQERVCELSRFALVSLTTHFFPPLSPAYAVDCCRWWFLGVDGLMYSSPCNTTATRTVAQLTHLQQTRRQLRHALRMFHCLTEHCSNDLR